jgi:methionine sulfoxide reductase heme-binding subunit
MNKLLTSKWTRAIVFLLCLVPLGLLIWRAVQGDLGANPIEYITHRTGDWTLRFLVITLAITPVRKILRLPQLIRFRRMLGLFAFFYGFLHFGTWIGIDKFFAWSEMIKDVEKRRFITVGFLGFVLMIPLALTSTAASIRRLGGKRWAMLHRLIYASAILGVIHYFWLVKSDIHKPLEYAFLVGILLAWRLGSWLIDRFRPATTAVAPPSRTTTPESA